MANLSFLTEGVVGHISLDKQAEARKQITERAGNVLASRKVLMVI